MTTATAPPPAEPPTDPPERLTPAERLFRIAGVLAPGQRARVADVSWDDYEALMTVRDEAGRHFRLTYDQGVLEIMPTSLAHELSKKILAILIELWLGETGGDFVAGGNVAVKQTREERGFEPDECYYVQNWARMAGKPELDLETDPPPDLVIEAEVSRTATGRLPVFAGLKVPEVWRYDGSRVVILLLGADGNYSESPVSRAIPNFPFTEVPRFLTMAANGSHAAVWRAFRDWVRSLPPAG